MNYREHPVPPALADAVDTIWTLEAGPELAGEAGQPVVPDGRSEIVLHFGDPFEPWSGRARWVVGGEARGVACARCGAGGSGLPPVPWTSRVGVQALPAAAPVLGERLAQPRPVAQPLDFGSRPSRWCMRLIAVILA